MPTYLQNEISLSSIKKGQIRIDIYFHEMEVSKTNYNDVLTLNMSSSTYILASLAAYDEWQVLSVARIYHILRPPVYITICGSFLLLMK